MSENRETYHILKATCDTVHLGGFSAGLCPVLTVNSGDRIHVETYTGFHQIDQAPPEFVPTQLREICQNLPNDRKVGSGPHLLTGPIYVRDALPSDVLEVRIDRIIPKLPVGFNIMRPGAGALPQRFSQERVQFVDLNLTEMTAEFPSGSGIHIPLTPFFGILGTATDELSRNSSPPGDYGGNMDNRQLQAGSRLFLPVFLPGAMFSIGDGHSAQGDGEVNLTAIETSMDGVIQLIVHKNWTALPLPFAETKTDWITMGFAPTLDQAFEQALTQMITFLEKFIGLDAEEAYTLCSFAVHFHITQVVNSPNRGVHGLLPKSILPKSLYQLVFDRLS